jgi:hypothetical protein
MSAIERHFVDPTTCPLTRTQTPALSAPKTLAGMVSAGYPDRDKNPESSKSEIEDTRAGVVQRKVFQVMSQVSRIPWQQGSRYVGEEGKEVKEWGGWLRDGRTERGRGEADSWQTVEHQEPHRCPPSPVGVYKVRRSILTGSAAPEEDGNCHPSARESVPTKGAGRDEEIGEGGTGREVGGAEAVRTISNAPTAFLTSREALPPLSLPPPQTHGRAGEAEVGALSSNVSPAHCVSNAVRDDIAELERQIALLESAQNLHQVPLRNDCQEFVDAGAKDVTCHSTRLQGAAGAKDKVSTPPTTAEEQAALECQALLQALDSTEGGRGKAARVREEGGPVGWEVRRDGGRADGGGRLRVSHTRQLSWSRSSVSSGAHSERTPCYSAT